MSATTTSIYMRFFAKFLLLAYRRQVAPEELNRVVEWTQKTRTCGPRADFHPCRARGRENVLCSPPNFLYLGSESMAEDGGSGRAREFAAGGCPQPRQPALVFALERAAG